MKDLEKPHTDIAKRLRAFRALLDFNQKDFAARHGFNSTQYANWELGNRRIPVEEAAKLEELYGLTLDFIYLGRLQTLPHKLAQALSDSPLESQYSKDSEAPAS